MDRSGGAYLLTNAVDPSNSLLRWYTLALVGVSLGEEFEDDEDSKSLLNMRASTRTGCLEGCFCWPISSGATIPRLIAVCSDGRWAPAYNALTTSVARCLSRARWVDANALGPQRMIPLATRSSLDGRCCSLRCNRSRRICHDMAKILRTNSRLLMGTRSRRGMSTCRAHRVFIWLFSSCSLAATGYCVDNH